MHIGNIIFADTANGSGIRVSVFVSGCLNHCEGCFNPQTWNFNYGKLYTKETEEMILNELSKDYYDGITILGGEPFELQNQPEVLNLINSVRLNLPSKNIWLYTGYSYDKDLIPGGCRYSKYTDAILDRIDVLIDGRFELDKKNISLSFRGSENQRLIDMKKSRSSTTVVLYEKI